MIQHGGRKSLSLNNCNSMTIGTIIILFLKYLIRCCLWFVCMFNLLKQGDVNKKYTNPVTLLSKFEIIGPFIGYLFISTYFSLLNGLPSEDEATDLDDYRVKRKLAKIKKLPISPVTFDKTKKNVYENAYDYFCDIGIVLDHETIDLRKPSIEKVFNSTGGCCDAVGGRDDPAGDGRRGAGHGLRPCAGSPQWRCDGAGAGGRGITTRESCCCCCQRAV